MSPPPKIDEALKSRLNQETAKIDWHELQRFYAGGTLIAVAKGLDLIEVACRFSIDDKTQVAQWLSAGQVFKVNDEQAAQWFEQQTKHWAVVIAPWVLVQEV